MQYLVLQRASRSYQVFLKGFKVVLILVLEGCFVILYFKELQSSVKNVNAYSKLILKIHLHLRYCKELVKES